MHSDIIISLNKGTESTVRWVTATVNKINTEDPKPPRACAFLSMLKRAFSVVMMSRPADLPALL